MSKETYTIIRCDRCGKTMEDEHYRRGFGALREWHIFKWFVSSSTRYRMEYICGDCWHSFKDWFDGGKTDEED